MGNVIKRLLATLLLVALFASFAVPATFADMEDTVEAVEAYNIRLYNPQQDQGYNSWFTKTVAMTGVRDKISKAYEAGELNWKYINASDEANTTYRSENLVRKPHHRHPFVGVVALDDPLLNAECRIDVSAAQTD